MITCTKQSDCPATSHFGDCLSMEYRRVDPPAAPAERCDAFQPNVLGVPEPEDQCVKIKGHEGKHSRKDGEFAPAAPDERDRKRSLYRYIGALIDGWETMPNDLKADMREVNPSFVKAIEGVIDSVDLEDR